MNGAVVVGDEPFLIDLTELVLRADADPLKDLLHFVLGSRKMHPLANKLAFVVLSEVGHKRFKASV